jgi:glycosyltransferase involved in cell wall biosynthesis
MRRIVLPALKTKTLETLSHTAASTVHATLIGRPTIAILFNAGNAPLLPVLKVAGIPVAVHMDGLEWQRAKWAGFGAGYYRAAERFAVKRADALIADSLAIESYVAKVHGVQARYIPYGAPFVVRDPDFALPFGVMTESFLLVVARFEPENHVLELVQGYAQSHTNWPLVVVGSAPYSDSYTRAIRAAALGSQVIFAGPVWDQNLLDQLYAHCAGYLHGHSVGGTNPSLLRALGAAAPVIAWDVDFNREVAGSSARYIQSAACLPAAIMELAADERARSVAASERENARRRYDWDAVAAQYEDLCLHLEARRR